MHTDNNNSNDNKWSWQLLLAIVKFTIRDGDDSNNDNQIIFQYAEVGSQALKTTSIFEVTNATSLPARETGSASYFFLGLFFEKATKTSCNEAFKPGQGFKKGRREGYLLLDFSPLGSACHKIC